MKNSFFAFVFRQKLIKRWVLMKSTLDENLTEHSAETAVIAHALAVIGNRMYGRHYDADRAAVIALYHDVPEVLTGDLPTPVKYFSSGMRDSYRDMERSAISTLISKLPSELASIYGDILNSSDSELKPIIKAADKLCAYIKCIDEEKSGNKEFKTAKASIYMALKEMDMPELEYFMTELLPAFSLTLDEM